MNDATDNPTSSPDPKPSNESSPPPEDGQAVSDAVRANAAASGSRPAGGPSAAPPPNADGPADARAEVERLKEQWMRTAADFDNFRKRARREVEDAKRTGREDLLRDLLPVFDNLERGIQSAQRATEVKAVADGLSMILKQFTETLARSGISKVAGVGNPFDPSVHEAIQQVETSDQPPGVIIAEVQPGYVQGERLVRAAMVVVSKAPGDTEPGTN